MAGRKRIEFFAIDLQHFGIARRDNGGGSGTACEKSDLADQLAGANFSDDLPLAAQDLKQAEIHNIQRVRLRTLLDDQFAAPNLSNPHRTPNFVLFFFAEVGPETVILVRRRTRHMVSPSIYFPSRLRRVSGLTFPSARLSRLRKGPAAASKDPAGLASI